MSDPTPVPLDADRLDAIAAEATDADLTLLRAERDAAVAELKAEIEDANELVELFKMALSERDAADELLLVSDPGPHPYPPDHHGPGGWGRGRSRDGGEMTDSQWVKVHDPNQVLPPCPDGCHYEVFHRGGYLIGGSYMNPYDEVRAIPNTYCNPNEEN